MENILDSIKKALGIDACALVFDADILMHINTVFMVLNQMGVGKDGFIVNEGSSWEEFLGEDIAALSGVKSYTYLRVKQLFDPNASQALNESINNIIKELEWRLYVSKNPNTTFKEGD